MSGMSIIGSRGVLRVSSSQFIRRSWSSPNLHAVSHIVYLVHMPLCVRACESPSRLRLCDLIDRPVRRNQVRCHIFTFLRDSGPESIARSTAPTDRTRRLSSKIPSSIMPLIERPLPSLLTTLGGPNPPPRPFLIFYSNIDETGRMWCPVRPASAVAIHPSNVAHHLPNLSTD